MSKFAEAIKGPVWAEYLQTVKILRAVTTGGTLVAERDGLAADDD